MNGLGDRVFHKAVQRHVAGHGGNHRLLVQLQGNTDIEAAIIGLLRFPPPAERTAHGNRLPHFRSFII